MKKFNKVLVLAPHPDDGEFSCGATIKKLIEEGAEVLYVMFSTCEKSIPKGFDKDVLIKELNLAVSKLGINKNQIIKFDFPVREFPKYRQEILDELIKLRNIHNPDLILLPNSNDIHQDHKTINQEGIRAFKHYNILGYELPWNSQTFTANFHVAISKNHLKAKWRAISQYKSQKRRPYFNEDFFNGLAVVRGTQANVKYAEAFELIHWNL